MAKLYWAGSKDSEEWHGPVSEIVEAKLDAMANGYDVAIWVAPVDAELDAEGASQFWQIIANRILANALREILGPRPAWRTVDTSKARRVEL